MQIHKRKLTEMPLLKNKMVKKALFVILIEDSNSADGTLKSSVLFLPLGKDYTHRKPRYLYKIHKLNILV